MAAVEAEIARQARSAAAAGGDQRPPRRGRAQRRRNLAAPAAELPLAPAARQPPARRCSTTARRLHRLPPENRSAAAIARPTWKTSAASSRKRPKPSKPAAPSTFNPRPAICGRRSTSRSPTSVPCPKSASEEVAPVASFALTRRALRCSRHTKRLENRAFPRCSRTSSVIRLARREFLAASAALAAAGSLPRRGLAADAVGPDPKQYEAVVTKGIDFLRTKGQADDGSFTRQIGIGVTALAATALSGTAARPKTRRVAKALKFLEASVQPTGGIHAAQRPPEDLRNVRRRRLLAAGQRGRQVRHGCSRTPTSSSRGFRSTPPRGTRRTSFYFGGAGYGGPGAGRTCRTRRS